MHRSSITAGHARRAYTGTAPVQVDLSVIIVNYNVREFLEQSLRSVERAARGLRAEVFVVDNGSVDGSVEMVRSHFPHVHLIANDENAGFARANNQAIRKAKGRFLLILNPDTIVQEDTLRTLVAFMDRHPEAGAVGCTILNPDGSFALESRRAFPTPAVAFYRIAGLSRLFPRSRRFGRYNLTYLPTTETAEVDALSGSCMLVRRAALYHSREEVEREKRSGAASDAHPASTPAGNGAGLLDEDFFMYGEDLDWCYRIQQAGWKVFYTPETRIIHYKGESTKKGELRYVRLFYGAMGRFAGKYFRDRHSRIFTGVLNAGILLRASATVAANVFRRLRVPALDFLLALCVIILTTIAYSLASGAAYGTQMYTVPASIHALAVVAGVAISRGYMHARRLSLRPALSGPFLGVMAIACVAFFMEQPVFSREVLLLSCPLIAATLSSARLAQKARSTSPRRAILVGPRAEAERLRTMLADCPAPSLDLLGYVDRRATRRSPRQPDPLRLGTMHQLRDLIRIQRVDDVIFAAAGFSNNVIITLIQHLNGLPVQFKILASGSHHIIGKASVENLVLPSLVEASATLAHVRTTGERRSFEMLVALAGIALYPLAWFMSTVVRRSEYDRLIERLRRLPDVLTGRTRLIGFHANERPLVPDELGLGPGVFSVAESLPSGRSAALDITKTYRLYATSQSASLDMDILLRSIRALLRRAKQ